ncbi:hypothetical protein [Aliterella atlantica]|uniref:Uncharacterized protein n=1 Tax=Aliterella atlantica CENA595 TaxID=1618023 RepID=A0A0D8ZVV0_9CYAN|nr:hypothetical protein [Aliterella atlantica]KJH71346.1 hypothetical protein UH38_13795 [Aliterella atlantica CENA595]
MSDITEIPFDQIRSWVRSESAKGRNMKEIVAELASSRNDVTILSVTDSPENRHQKIVGSLQKLSANN